MNYNQASEESRVRMVTKERTFSLNVPSEFYRSIPPKQLLSEQQLKQTYNPRLSKFFAGRVTYVGRYNAGIKDKETGRTTDNRRVADDKDEAILKGMTTWSDGKYEATQSRHKMIIVQNVDVVATKTEAS
ncbi:hypothetical protein BO71DRAFT_429971 [Aspergillus ellipticus CBS 707.79]|uniref:Uncharacterized protein n=1 Tax=Aspergillus ellipticus CBS 707.79 TaxID=1448320 RepID=A0A319ETL7_9EURO|nr:hypothetical protein BO71DRAFT_429971 [Aspergillus ellipticus CBS 707.79]